MIFIGSDFAKLGLFTFLTSSESCSSVCHGRRSSHCNRSGKTSVLDQNVVLFNPVRIILTIEEKNAFIRISFDMPTFSLTRFKGSMSCSPHKLLRRWKSKLYPAKNEPPWR
jgi:hypothetical protein